MNKIKKSNQTRLSLRDLVTNSRTLVKNAKRDAGQLANYGITAEYLTDLEAKIDALDNVTRHEIVRSLAADTTHLRNLSIKELQYFLRILTAQIEMVYEITDSKKPGFLTKSINNKNVNSIIDFGKNLSIELSEKFETYAIAGIKPERIAQLNELVQKVQNLHETKSFEYTQIDNKTDERSAIRSQVETAVLHLSRIGKAHWGLEKMGYYKDYNLYKSATKTTNETPGTPTPALPDPEADS